MGHTDWIPTKEDELRTFFGHWSEILNDSAKVAAYGWAPTAVAAMLSKINGFEDACVAYDNGKTPGNQLTKTEKTEEAVAEARNFANTSIRFNDKMTSAQKLDMGIRPVSHSHAPKPKPQDHVSFGLFVDGQGHTVTAPYQIMNSDSKSKGSYHGVEVRFWVMPLAAPPPAGPDHSGWRSEVDTGSPWTHKFADDEIGMRLHITMRWENKSAGKRNTNTEDSKGPWSGIQNMVIA